MKYYIKELLRNALDLITSIRLTIKEFWAIAKFNRKSRLESLMLVAAHSLEKGMGIKNTRFGYGQKKATNLINYLKDYCEKGYDCNCFAFIESFRMVEAYLRFQDDGGCDISNIKHLFNELVASHQDKFSEFTLDAQCGFVFYEAEKLLKSKAFPFEEFVSLRHSIRDFKTEVVPANVVKEAVEIANQAPSACNRQPIKVYCTSSIETASKVDDLITGTSGFKQTISNFALITCERSYFSGKEAYQWYVNGGIYLSFFVLALHSLGIGSVIMQWFAFHRTEAELKRLMGIGKSEAIVAVVGFGYYPNEVKCIKAQRKSINETIRFV